MSITLRTSLIVFSDISHSDETPLDSLMQASNYSTKTPSQRPLNAPSSSPIGFEAYPLEYDEPDPIQDYTRAYSLKEDKRRLQLSLSPSASPSLPNQKRIPFTLVLEYSLPGPNPSDVVPTLLNDVGNEITEYLQSIGYIAQLVSSTTRGNNFPGKLNLLMILFVPLFIALICTNTSCILRL